MVLAVRILGLTEDQNQARERFPIIIPMRFEDFDILINKGFLNDTREFDQYIAYGTEFEVICNRFTEEEDRTRLWKRQKSF